MKRILLLVVALVSVVSAEPSRPRISSDLGVVRPPPYINRPRFPRSAEAQGSIVFTGKKPLSGPERRPSYSLDYQHKIWQGKNGHVSATGGAQKLPGQRLQPTVGMQGTWRFRRSPDPKKKKDRRINVEVNKPMSGPERRPSVNVDYQQDVWKGKNGAVSVGAGAQKEPGQRWKPNVGVQGSWRFRRSPDPKKKKKKNRRINVEVNKPISGPERRPSVNVDYQQDVWKGKNGAVSVGAGAQKRPGQRWKSNVGVQGSWRFRRSPDPKKKKDRRINVEVNKPMSGPERRPSVNVDYQQDVWKGKNGAVSVGAGAQKDPGQRWKSNVGVQGSWRFRRSPDPKKKKKNRRINVEVNKPISGPERRPSVNVDYQQDVWKGKNGAVSVGAGAQKDPGQRWKSNVGVKGSWRFRRSPDVQALNAAEMPKNAHNRCPPSSVNYQQTFPNKNVGNKSPQQNVGNKSPQQNVGNKSPQQNVGNKGSIWNLGNKSMVTVVPQRRPIFYW